jgi:gliding motility-associated-like protein
LLPSELVTGASCYTVRFSSNNQTTGSGFVLQFQSNNFLDSPVGMLGCGEELTGTFPFFETCSENVVQYYACQGEIYGGYGNCEKIFDIVGTGQVTVNIDVSPGAYAQLTGVAEILPGPNFCGTNLGFNVCFVEGSYSYTYNAQDYPFGVTLVLDGSFFGDYVVSVSCEPCPDNPVECDEFILGTFPGLQNSLLEDYCADLNLLGGEHTYTFVPDQSGFYTFHTASDDIAPHIIISDCCIVETSGGGDVVLVSGEECPLCEYAISGGNENQLTVFLTAGETYYIYIEDQCNCDYSFWIECPGGPCEDLITLECEDHITDTNDPSQSDPTPQTNITDEFDTHNQCNNATDGCFDQGFSTTFTEPEVLYRLINTVAPTIDYDVNVCIDIFPREPGLDVDLFVYEDCDIDELSGCVAASTRKPGLIDGILLQEVPRFDEFILVVDGQSHATEDNRGLYDIHITCGNLCNKPAQPILCGNSILGELDSNDGNVSSHYCCAQTENFPPNNSGHTGEDFSGGGNTGPEDIYYFDINANGTTVTITLDILTPGQDLELFLLESCDVTTCLDRSIRGPGNSETITYTLQTGRYYIVVEGTDFDAGAYRLSISGCELCNLFPPNPVPESNEVIFDNESGFVCKYFLVQAPYDSLDTDNMLFTFSDSIAVNSPNDLVYRFPFPGCYQLCFYYCDEFGNMYECCFKYCHEGKRYDCSGGPVPEIINETQTHTNVRFHCPMADIPIEPGRSMDCDDCHITVRPTDSDTEVIYDVEEIISLPYGEYEVCCWRFDPVCMYWEICCEIYCFPYITPAEQACGSGEITLIQMPNQYVYTYEGNYQTLDWEITPNLPHVLDANHLIITTPDPGTYKVCAIATPMTGGILLPDTCCVYLCVDDLVQPPINECFDIIPLDPNHVILECVTGRPVLRWEIAEWILPVPIVIGIYYGPNPSVQLEEGKRYRIRKYYAGCCGEEEYCEKEICWEDPFTCHLVRPVFVGEFGDPTDLTYQFNIESEYEGTLWQIDETGEIIGQQTNQVTYTFSQPGDYTISVIIWDPFSMCYRICCKRIRVGYPYACDLIYSTFTGSADATMTYDLFLVEECGGGYENIQWMINGTAVPEFDGYTDIRELDLGIWVDPGETVAYVCVMFYDPCLQVCGWCCYKIEITPPFPCQLFTHVFIAQNQYNFSAPGSYEDSYWGIGGMDERFNPGATTFNLQNPLIQQFIVDNGQPYLNVCFYYKVNGCWKVCCRRICLDGSAECDDASEYCEFYTPIFFEDFDFNTPEGYPYDAQDSVTSNSTWWSGDFAMLTSQEAIVPQGAAIYLDLENVFTNPYQTLLVEFDFGVEWFRDLMNGTYSPSVSGDFCLSDVNRQCVAGSLQQLMNATPGVQFDFCGGGSDIEFCFSHVEILIDKTGPVRMWIDDRLVMTDLIAGALIDYLRFDGLLTIDNVRISECGQCTTPVLDPDDYVYCPEVILAGVQHNVNGDAIGIFSSPLDGAAWSAFDENGILISQVTTPDSTWTCPPLDPGSSYYICRTFINSNGCEELCCVKYRIPDACDLFLPYFTGDENTLEYTFTVDDIASGDLEIDSWYVNGQRVAGAVNSFNYTFAGPGRYVVCAVFWDPILQCFVWCCREICVDFPLDCSAIIIDYDGSEDEYILRVNGNVDIISWNIDQPTGLPNNGFIGSANPQRFSPADFGIAPGTEIIISVRYIDSDGCIVICCKRLCLPAIDPLAECDNIFPRYLGEGLEYQFYVDPVSGISDITWRLHIPGTEEVIDIGTGPESDELDFEALMLQYPSLTLDKVCISILYFDQASGCYRICCKCFCLQDLPLDCDDIEWYYTGTESSPLEYHLSLDVPGALYVEWRMDETNTVIGTTSMLDIDFADYGMSVGDNQTITVRYFDPVSQCFRVCCKRVCFVDPYPGNCSVIQPQGVQGNDLTISTSAANPSWTIEGLSGLYGADAQITIDLADPDIEAIIGTKSFITVCITYMDGNCCIVCCEDICVIPSAASCDDFTVTVNDLGNQFEFVFNDANPIAGLRTLVTLPNLQIVELAGDVTSYDVSAEGNYTLCREYLDACGDTLTCCTTLCLSHALVCTPFTYTVDPNNDHLFTFTHDIIGGSSYLWDFGDGETSTSDLTSVTHEFDNASSFEVCLTVTNECGETCTHCAIVQVGEVNLNPIVINPSCFNLADGSIDLNVVGGTPPVNIQWSNGSPSDEFIAGLAGGMYTATITDGGGFDTVLSFQLTPPLSPALVIDVVATACGELNGSISITSSNETSLSAFVWQPASVTDTDGFIEGLDAGTYSAVITDEHGCLSIADEIVVAPSQSIPLISLGPDVTLCPGQTMTLSTGTINAGNINIEWLLDQVVVATNTNMLLVDQPGMYIVIVSNGAACIRTDTIQVAYHPVSMVLPQDVTDVVPGSSITVEVMGAMSATWGSNELDLSCTSCLQTTFTVNTNALLWLEATDVNNCTVMDTIDVTIDVNPVEGPNFMTPNGDGDNDYLVLKNLDLFSHRKLVVFNRWGQILVTIDDYDNEWDGQVDGKLLPDGAYYYVLEYGQETPGQFTFISDLTILSNR